MSKLRTQSDKNYIDKDGVDVVRLIVALKRRKVRPEIVRCNGKGLFENNLVYR